MDLPIGKKTPAVALALVKLVSSPFKLVFINLNVYVVKRRINIFDENGKINELGG